MAELCLIALASAVALVVRDNFELSPDRLRGLLPYLLLTLAVAIPVWLALGLHRTIWRFSAMTDYLRVLAAVAATVFLSIAVGFTVNRLDGVARSIPLLQALFMGFALVGARVLARLKRSRPKRSPLAPVNMAGHENVLVIGLNAITELYLRSVAEFAADRVRVAGILADRRADRGRVVHQHKVLGTTEEIEGILLSLDVHGMPLDRIVVTQPVDRLSVKAQKALIEVETTSNIRLDFFAERIGLDAHAEHRPAAVSSPAATDLPAIFSFSASELHALLRRPYWRIRRALDIVAALVWITALSWLICVVAMLVAVDVGLPLTFWQQRPGARGRPFRLYKFRTMAAAHDRMGQREADKDRLSVIGRFLRRTRLDELPQLYNILTGEMSFVGPRPLLPADQSPALASRLLVRPGLTGWAQVKGGREISVADKAALDVWYVRNASLALDLEILLRTLPMVLFGERLDRQAISRAWDELRRSGVCIDEGNAPDLRDGLTGDLVEQAA